MADDEKGNRGNISADISQAAIDAALAAVEKRQNEAAAATPEARVAELEKENEQLKQRLELAQTRGKEALGQLKEEHERVLRAAADLDNQKKRAQREKEEAVKFGLESFLKQFLLVADDMDRALAHTDAADKDSLISGVKMVAKQIENVLAKHGVESFSAKGQAFDPRVHEAMSAVEADGPPNMVHEEMMRGYTLHGRLIRAAVVSVTRARAAAPPESNSSPATEPAQQPSPEGASSDSNKPDEQS